MEVERYNYVFDRDDGDIFIYDSLLNKRIENLDECADILNSKDNKIKELETKLKENKNCQTCSNRFICPTYRENECCMGYNDEQVFGSLLKMMFGGMANEHIDGMLKRVKIIQGRLPDERI